MMKNYNFSKWHCMVSITSPQASMEGKSPSAEQNFFKGSWKASLILSFFLSLFLTQEISAQASLYSFAQSNETYTPITGGTVVTTSTAGVPDLDSFVSTSISIPYFPFAGTPYTQMYVTGNGQVSLGATAPSGTTYTVLSSTTGGNVFLAPLSADLDDNIGVSEIRYETIGNELVVQWQNFRRYSRTETLNFQVRMNTATGVIKFVYDGTPPYDVSTVYQPQVGIKSAVGTYNALTVAAAGNWNSPVNITTGIVAASVATFTGNVGPTSGLTYTWTPNLLAVPNCASSLLPADLATDVARNPILTWANGGGYTTSYDVYFGTSTTPALVGNQLLTTYVPPAPLAPNTTYYWKVVAKNTSGEATGCTQQSFTTGATVLYCTPSSTGSATYINNFATTFGTTNISNASGYTTGGYQDNYSSAAVTSVPTGSFSFNMTVTGGTLGAAIWVDWNSNGTFEATERVFVTSAYGSGPYTGSITVPAGTPVGDYRMRVMVDYNNSAPSNPCITTSARMETEDYKITVNAQPVCSGTPTAAAITSTMPSVCVSGSVTLTATIPASTDSGFTYQWYNTTGAIAGATTNTYTTPTLSAPESYFFKTTCTNSGLSASSNTIVIGVTNPQLLTTTPGSRCGVGTVNLSATSSAGATLNWYATATGGSSLGTGATFTTPSISTTTDFYVAASEGSILSSASKLNSNGADGSYVGTDSGIVFSTTSSITLVSTTIYPTGTGTVTIGLYNSAGVELMATAPIAVTGSGINTPVSVPLNFAIPIGTGYRLLLKAYTGITGLIRDSSGNTFPYNSANVSVTAGYISASSASYYFFYNLQVTTSCSSARTAVTATVNTSPALTLSSASSTICAGTSSNAVTVTAGGSDYDTFVWSPSTGVTGTAADGFIFNPTATTTYTLTATNAAACSNVVSHTVTVNPLPTAITITPNTTACSSETTMLSVLSGGSINITPIDEPFATTTLPANWVKQVGAGDAIAVVAGTTSGGTGNQLVITGNSQTALITDRAYFGPINSVGLSTMTLQWNNFLNHYSSSPYVYSAKIQTSIDGVNWHDTSWSYSPVTASIPVGLQTATIATTDVGSPSLYVAFTVEGRTFGMHNWNIDNVKLTGSVTNDIIWSPATNLYTDAAATVAYVTGTPASNVYVKSSTAGSQTYTATATIPDTGCVSTATTTVTTTVTAQPTASAQTFCTGATVADLVATGAGLNWYSALTGGNALTNTAVLATGSYYVSQTLNACESTRVLVDVTVNAAPTATITRADDTLTVSEVNATYQWIMCDASSTPIAGATNQDYTATATGSYAVMVTQNGCTSTSDCFEITTLSNNKFDFAKLGYYPNPVNDVLTVTHSENISSIRVYDVTGRLVRQMNPNNNEVLVDMTNMPASIYIVKVSMENTSGEFKVIKK